MLRSMFTAISSLNVHQGFLDVVADNLANANTTGFKANRVLFQDQYAQLVSSGGAPTGDLGGINPTQIGLGVRMGSITAQFTQGALQSTGRNSDLSIQGDGFFVYKNGIQNVYSREGSLQLDSNGYLVNGSTGMRIQGWKNDLGVTAPINTNNPLSDIQVPMDGTLAQPTSSMILGGNLSSSTATNGKVPVTIGVYDSLGHPQPLTITFSRTDDNNWSWSVTSPTGAGVTGSGTIAFTTGGVGTPTVTNPISIPGSAGAAAVTIPAANLDMSGISMKDTANSVAVTSQNGLAPGSVSDIQVSANSGEVYLIYSNGLKQLAGLLAIAKFANPSGLVRNGHNTFDAGLNSGEPNVGAATVGGRGTINPGYLEASNVDMAQEFTNMILAQRGFQASSRVITTSDEVLQELVNLKR
jgi:flagellar hook protein FlgE